MAANESYSRLLINGKSLAQKEMGDDPNIDPFYLNLIKKERCYICSIDWLGEDGWEWLEGYHYCPDHKEVKDCLSD